MMNHDVFAHQFINLLPVIPGVWILKKRTLLAFLTEQGDLDSRFGLCRIQIAYQKKAVEMLIDKS
jgi:hypothetical protein